MMSHRMWRVLGPWTSLVGPRIAAAQTDVGELVTDQPDFTESSRVVGRGISWLGHDVERYLRPGREAHLGEVPATRLRAAGQRQLLSPQ